MKKLVSIFIVFALLLFLAACSNTCLLYTSGEGLRLLRIEKYAFSTFRRIFGQNIEPCSVKFYILSIYRRKYRTSVVLITKVRREGHSIWIEIAQMFDIFAIKSKKCRNQLMIIRYFPLFLWKISNLLFLYYFL